jgi:hypothetical protein
MTITKIIGDNVTLAQTLAWPIRLPVHPFNKIFVFVVDKININPIMPSL